MTQNLVRMIFALLNLLGVAGVGTYLSGRKRIGVIQIILSLSFFSLTLLPMLYLISLIKKMEGIGYLTWQIGVYQGEYQMRAEYFPPFLIALGAMVLFFINMLWSLTTTKPRADTPPPLP